MSDWQKRYQRLVFDRPHPKVLRVTMNRPEKYNATDAIMHRELVDVWRDIDGADLAGLEGASKLRDLHHRRERAPPML